MPTLPSLATACEAPILRHVIQDHGREKVLLVMRLALAQTIDVMTVVQPPNVDPHVWQNVFVQDFLSQYDTESLDDFALFLQMFRRGELGEAGKPQLYGGRVDGVVLFECWARYMDRKAGAVEGMHQMRKSEAFKQISDAVNASPNMRKLSDRLTKESRDRELRRASEQMMAAERHKLEGVREVEKAFTLAELLHVVNLYPYQSVRNMARLRALDLKLNPDDICQA